MKRLAIITTHPIQYNAPLFKLLSERNKVDIKVFYTWSQSEQMNIYDPGFGINKAWDIPLLEGYKFAFPTNISKKPGSHHFRGVVNPSLIKEIEAFKPDALLVYGWSFVSHLRAMRYFKNKIPVLFRGDSTLESIISSSVIKRRLRSVVLRWVYKYIDIALYAGTLNKEYYSHAGLKEHQLIFMPHAVDNVRFSNAPVENVAVLKQKLGIPGDAIVLVFAGKLEWQKDPAVLLEAFRQMNNNDVHLVMVGNGALEPSLKEKFSSCKNVHFVPFQNQSAMPVIYALADVFVLPSKSETWGLGVNEAMAAGKAIVVSDRCGCSVDLVKERENGLIFRTGDINDLKDKLTYITALDKGDIKMWGSRSGNIIANWTYEVCASVIEKRLS